MRTPKDKVLDQRAVDELIAPGLELLAGAVFNKRLLIVLGIILIVVGLVNFLSSDSNTPDEAKPAESNQSAVVDE